MDKQFWTDKYKSNNIGWDIGYISTPLKEYIDQISDKSLKILIPGAGNSYEIEYLWKLGFKNCYALDISEEPLQNIKKRCPDFPNEHLLCNDFFKVNDSEFDLIIEQTFFCALNPNLRKQYVEQMYRLLKKGGKLSGVLFDFDLSENGPPFGGSKEEYLSLFEPKFEIKILERCYNSIPPRSGNELFFSIRK